MLAVGSENIQIWDVAAGSAIREINGSPVSYVSFSPDNRYFISYELAGKKVSLWQVMP